MILQAATCAFAGSAWGCWAVFFAGALRRLGPRGHTRKGYEAYSTAAGGFFIAASASTFVLLWGLN